MSDSLQSYGPNTPGSSVHGILQAGILDWVAMLSTQGPNPHLLCFLHCQVSSLSLVLPGKSKPIVREFNISYEKSLMCTIFFSQGLMMKKEKTGKILIKLYVSNLDETYELIDLYYEEGGEVETFFMMILEEYAKSMGLGMKFKEIMKQQQN